MYDFKKIEKKWQDKWEKEKIFEVKENPKKKKYYLLEQFPYSSGTGLHMGHAFIYTIGDIYARFKRMNGFNVLYPMGYDSLGLPAENAAIKEKIHPKKYTEDSIKNFIKQQKSLGLSYDWNRMIKTHDPEYYKWDQWIFLKMFKKGLTYKKESPVNWCPECKTVLANEQVHNGKCWRHEKTNVEIKHLSQWYLKITDYAEELNKELDNLKGWPDLIKKLQKNWIGKSYGTEINFKINGENWPIFTTRADTLFGVTFMVVSAQHPRLNELVTEEQKSKVNNFVKKLSSVSEEQIDQLEKEGVFTGSYAIHPLTNEKIPVYAGNFVLTDYGCGMVMAVPAHDQRDFEFAKKYKIKIKPVVIPLEEKDFNAWAYLLDYQIIVKKDKVDKRQILVNLQKAIKENNLKQAYIDKGELINSGEFNGINSNKAIEEITKYLEKKKLGKKKINFKLKDWLISRQRYWGTPIPIIYCNKCGVVPVPEKELPVELPDKVKFGEGNPLTTNKNFVNTKCPKCKCNAKRETDTMDTFVNSSWYYLRYLDNKNNKKIFEPKKANYWIPIDMYIGGKEHACMHLIYIRFYTKFLRDLGLLKINEPALNLFVQGILYGKDGNKMSKSLGNVIDPLDTINKYGADSLRLYLVSVASPNSDFIWSDIGMQGSFKFVNKVFNYFTNVKIGKSSEKFDSKINKAIKEITSDVENFRYNLAIIKLRLLFENFEDEISKENAMNYLKLLYIFCPHIAEELWNKIKSKSFICLEKWPVADEKKINEKFEEQEKIIEKLKSDINNIKKITGKENPKVYVYVLPKEIEIYKDVAGINLFSVSDREKYDPEGKSKKAKPGKPAIYLE